MRETKPQGSAVGIDFSDFQERFGGSFRRKHLTTLPETRLGWLQHLGNLLLHPSAKERRLYSLPSSAGIGEFIRLDPWEGEYVYLLASLASLGILEIGRLYGGSTFLLACANHSIPIWSIDTEPRKDKRGAPIPSSETWDYRLRAMFDKQGVGDNVQLLVGDSQHDCFPDVGEYDLLFVDGEHTYEGVTADLEQHFPQLAPGGHALLHDCVGEVAMAALDFATQHHATFVRIPASCSHWTFHGSIGHFRKQEQ